MTRGIHGVKSKPEIAWNRLYVNFSLGFLNFPPAIITRDCRWRLKNEWRLKITFYTRSSNSRRTYHTFKSLVVGGQKKKKTKVALKLRFRDRLTVRDSGTTRIHSRRRGGAHS